MRNFLSCSRVLRLSGAHVFEHRRDSPQRCRGLRQQTHGAQGGACLMPRKLWAAVLTAVTAVGFLPMLAVGPAAHAATNEGLKLATSVSNEPIVPDPGPADRKSVVYGK